MKEGRNGCSNVPSTGNTQMKDIKEKGKVTQFTSM